MKNLRWKIKDNLKLKWIRFKNKILFYKTKIIIFNNFKFCRIRKSIKLYNNYILINRIL